MGAIHRPIATLSLAAALLVAGLWTAARIPLEWTPRIELPVVRIAASWPGAAPRVVERYITAPIEAAVQAVAGAASVESISEEGRASVSIEVAQETDLATFIAEVNDRLVRLHSALADRVRPFLTKDVPEAQAC
jgi:hydrophobic/amphiphilic exporter-1 (mainly G- bacteria), HAE1 family